MPDAVDENDGFNIWMTSEVTNYNLQFKCIMFAFLLKKHFKNIMHLCSSFPYAV